MKLFELFATLGLQTGEFEKGVQNATKQGNSFASSISGNFTAISAKAVALGNAIYDVGKVLAKSSAEAVKSIITEYAETEQLVGGVETIFKGSAQRVIENAENAFRTAGMSANDYMQTVTSFSSSLLQGLGGDTETAAKVADMAIQDMSDNANKFGTNMSLIQNAYQGFAKDNFTMLDNLKLGYGGTQAEMARLINDSGVLGDTIVTAATVAQVPLDKMFEAIHIIQTEMDIAGTTAKEAASTISGSFNAFNAAWKNLISGMADDKDMDKLIDDLFETGENLVTNVLNLMPRIWDNVIEGVDSLLDRWDLFQKLKQAYSEGGWQDVWKEATDVLSDAFSKWGTMAFNSGAEILSQILTGLTGNTVTAEEIKATLSGLWAEGSSAASSFVSTASNVLSDIYESFTGQEASVSNIKATLEGLFTNGQSSLEAFLNNAKGLLTGIYEGLTSDEAAAGDIGIIVGGLFKEGIESISNLKGVASNLLGAIYTILTGQEATADNIGNTIGGVFNAGIDAANNVLTTATDFFSNLNTKLGDPDASIGEKIGSVFNAGSIAMFNLLADAGTFMSKLYAAISGDTEGAKKVQEWVDSIFARPEDIEARNAAMERPIPYTPERLLGMAGSIFASPYDYGTTESEVDNWITILSQGVVAEGYKEIAQAVIEAYESVHPQSPVADEESSMLYDVSDELDDAIAELKTVIESTPSAISSGLSGIIVQMDGTTVGHLVAPTVSSDLARIAKTFSYFAVK